MAEDPDSTSSLDEADWISATKLGENITQINYGAWIIAPGDIRDALLGGCPAMLELEQNGQKSYAIPPPGFWLPPDRLRWVNALNPSMRREDYPDRPWPWELRAYLSPSESWEVRHLDGSPIAREQVDPTLRVFLRRAEAAQWRLPLESPQAVAREESPPREQPGEPTVGSAGGEAAPAPTVAADASAPAANTEVPVAESEVAWPPLGDVTTAETPAANTAPPVNLDGRPTDRAQSILEQNTETSSASATSSPTAPQTDPAPSSIPKKRSHRKPVYQRSQGKRAGAVLDRIFKDRDYPTETEVVWADLWHQFCEEYKSYMKDKPPSNASMPSERTVRRRLGWE